MRSYRRERSHRPPGVAGRLAPIRRAVPPPLVPTSVATALQEMGILQTGGAPTAQPAGRPGSAGLRQATQQAVEDLPRPLLLFLSLTCFLLLLGLIAWHPWR